MLLLLLAGVSLSAFAYNIIFNLYSNFHARQHGKFLSCFVWWNCCDTRTPKRISFMTTTMMILMMIYEFHAQGSATFLALAQSSVCSLSKSVKIVSFLFSRDFWFLCALLTWISCSSFLGRRERPQAVSQNNTEWRVARPLPSFVGPDTHTHSPPPPLPAQVRWNKLEWMERVHFGAVWMSEETSQRKFRRRGVWGEKEEICVYIVHDTKGDFIFMVMMVRYVFKSSSSPSTSSSERARAISTQPRCVWRLNETRRWEIYRILMGIFAFEKRSGMNQIFFLLWFNIFFSRTGETILLHLLSTHVAELTVSRCCFSFSNRYRILQTKKKLWYHSKKCVRALSGFTCLWILCPLSENSEFVTDLSDFLFLFSSSFCIQPDRSNTRDYTNFEPSRLVSDKNFAHFIWWRVQPSLAEGRKIRDESNHLNSETKIKNPIKPSRLQSAIKPKNQRAHLAHTHLMPYAKSRRWRTFVDCPILAILMMLIVAD